MLVRLLNLSFLVLIFSLPFVQPLNFSFSNQEIQITDVVFLSAAAVFGLGIILKKTKFEFDRFFLLLVFYLFALLLSAVFSDNPSQSFVKLFGEIYLFGLCVLTFNVVRDLAMFKRTVFVWLAATGIVSVVGTATVTFFYLAPNNYLLSFALHHHGTLIPGNYPRIQATFHYPAMLCNYLSISLMFLFAARKNGWISRTIFLSLLTIIAVSLCFTITPGLGGVGLSVGLWFWLSAKENSNLRLARFSLLAGIFLAIGFFCASLVSPIQTATSPYYVRVPIIEKRLDPSVRVLTWQSSFDAFLKSPVFGKGAGTDAANVIYKDASDRMQNLRDAHQIWLNVAAESGVFGLAAILLITIYFCRKSFPLRFDGTGESVIRAGLAIAFIGSFVYQGLVGSFEDARQIWVLFGLILAARKFNSSP